MLKPQSRDQAGDTGIAPNLGEAGIDLEPDDLRVARSVGFFEPCGGLGGVAEGAVVLRGAPIRGTGRNPGGSSRKAPVQNRPEYWVWVKPLRAAAGALILWLLVFGLTSLYLRYCSGERRLARYLADASYWMYLLHMPVVMVFQMALAPLAWPAAVKVPLVVALSFGALALSYDVGVRATWVGALLNGRRYPRWLASAGPEGRMQPETSPLGPATPAESPAS